MTTEGCLGGGLWFDQVGMVKFCPDIIFATGDILMTLVPMLVGAVWAGLPVGLTSSGLITGC